MCFVTKTGMMVYALLVFHHCSMWLMRASTSAGRLKFALKHNCMNFRGADSDGRVEQMQILNNLPLHRSIYFNYKICEDDNNEKIVLQLRIFIGISIFHRFRYYCRFYNLYVTSIFTSSLSIFYMFCYYLWINRHLESALTFGFTISTLIK